MKIETAIELSIILLLVGAVILCLVLYTYIQRTIKIAQDSYKAEKECTDSCYAEGLNEFGCYETDDIKPFMDGCIDECLRGD